MGRVTYHIRSDRSRLVIVDSESQAEAMFTLKDLDEKPTLVLVPFSFPMKSAQTASVGLTVLLTFELIADEHDIARVSYFTINPHGGCKYPVNIAKITFKGQDLPDSIYIGGAFCKIKPYISPPHQCQNYRRFGYQAKYCRSIVCCPFCASPGHTCTN